MSAVVTIERVRSDRQIGQFSEMVWEFFDFLRTRYPEMLKEIDEYIAYQDVAAQLKNFRQHYNPPAGEAFMGTVDSEPLGICQLKTRAGGAGGAELNRMYVRKEARGLGLGRRLACSVIDEARLLGHEMLYLGALYRHREALPLYESLGFERYHGDDEQHGNDARVIHMRMSLRAVTQ